MQKLRYCREAQVGVCGSGASTSGRSPSQIPSYSPRPNRCRSGLACAKHTFEAVSALPAEHVQASKRALQQLKDQQTNRYAGTQKSSIISIGLTIHTAPIELREKLALPEGEWPRAIEELCRFPHIEEAAVLSTCNRLELYVVALSWHRGVREVEEWLSRSSGIPLAQLRPHLFLLRDRDATSHLLRVAGGLDSVVLGEGQILSQVRQAYKVGQNCPGFGRHLNGLFKQALTAGKRVRTETAISSGTVSVSTAAVELAMSHLPSRQFTDVGVCVLGAGKMATLLVRHLVARGCKKMTLVNRGLPRAQALAAQVLSEFPDVEIDVRLMPDLLRSVAAADVVFSASSCEELLLTAADVAALPSASAAAGVVRRFVDISVPRSVAAAVGALPGTALFNVDDLRGVVSANLEERTRAATEAEVLLQEEQRSFEGWRESLDTIPTIKALRSKAEGIRAAEFAKAVAKLGEGLSLAQLRAVEELSRGIVSKLLHGPMTSLRCDGADAGAVAQTLANMGALEQMFELSGAGAAKKGGPPGGAPPAAAAAGPKVPKP